MRRVVEQRQIASVPEFIPNPHPSGFSTASSQLPSSIGQTNWSHQTSGSFGADDAAVQQDRYDDDGESDGLGADDESDDVGVSETQKLRMQIQQQKETISTLAMKNVKLEADYTALKVKYSRLKDRLLRQARLGTSDASHPAACSGPADNEALASETAGSGTQTMPASPMPPAAAVGGPAAAADVVSEPAAAKDGTPAIENDEGAESSARSDLEEADSN